MPRAFSRLSLSLFSFIALATPGFAHHAMGGQTPDTVWTGLATGMTHPVIGVDHLAFILAIGVLAAFSRATLAIPLAFVSGTLAGCLVAVAGVSFAATEWMVLVSLLAIGLALALGYKKFGALELALIALAGLFHGMAYAGGIIGAESSPLLAYLVGFALVQAAIAVGAMYLTRAIWKGGAVPLAPRVLGGIVVGIGFAFGVEGVEALMFTGIA